MRRRKPNSPAELIVSLVALSTLASIYFWQEQGTANSDGAAVLLFSLGLLIVVVAALIIAYVLRERRLRALRLADIDNMDGLQFEQYVARLFQHRGFQVKVTRASGDLGVDIIARSRDRSYAVQVKRVHAAVSRRAVSDAVAGKTHYGCHSAMVVTNSYFTQGAKDLAVSTRCELVNRDTLANWITEYAAANPQSIERARIQKY